MTVASRAFFLDAGSRGQRFCLHVTPAPGQAPRARLLFLPPFADEMNKARRMVAVQALALADAGCEVLLFDPLGCGDSSGEFSDASWQDWLDDASLALQWLQGRPGAAATATAPVPLWLWGLRSGALLAGALAQQQIAARAASPRLLLWQPQASGRQQLQQFLRLRLAAGLAETASAGTPSPMAGLRAQLARGDTLEVAGYGLSAALAQGLEQARLQPLAGVDRLVWLEVSPHQPATLLPASGPALQAWRDAGVPVQAQAVHGPSFWAAAEIEEAPLLCQASLQAVLADEGPRA